MKDFTIKDTQEANIKRIIISEEGGNTIGVKADTSILKKLFIQIKSEFEEKK